MGNTTTKQKDAEKGLAPLLDKIATQYIITQNFKDLANLENQAYCDKLIILTSKIFNKFLDKQDIKYLEQRMAHGALIDRMKYDTLIYLERDNLGNLDVKNPIQKKRMCIGIAQFYIKVGHVFAAILKTLNPEYVYKNQYGERLRVSILDKKNSTSPIINLDNKPKINLDNNLCARRIKALTPKKNQNNKFNIRVCKINRPSAVTPGIPGASSNSRKFISEIGIPELRFLYFDRFDYSTGQFTKMTKKSKKEYLQDVKTFYKIFTGKSKMPADITQFSQIPLGDFHNQPLCHEPDGLLRQAFSYDSTNNIYIPYAKHLSNMMNNAANNQNKLIAILNKLFVKEINPQNKTKKEQYTIHPSLTINKLQNIVVETRKLIIGLYTQCEKDFRTGIKLFEAVIEKKEQVRNENRLKHLQDEFNKLLD